MLSRSVFDLLTLAAFLAIVIWLFIRALKNSDDRQHLISRWIWTAVILGLLLVFVFIMSKYGGGNGYPADAGVAFVFVGGFAAFGLALGIIWTPYIGAWLARPFENLLTGGDQEIEATPLYSIAEAKRKRGKYREAFVEIRKQLERFPNDFRATMILAEIQAEDMNDVPGAEHTVEQFLLAPDASASQRSIMLTRLADWHLARSHDPDAARLALERIVNLFPDTEYAHVAHQRLAHLGGSAVTQSGQPQAPIALPRGIDNVGLQGRDAVMGPLGEDPAITTANYVKQLEKFPNDNHAREKLAILYAEHYRRMDLAADQLEQLIAQPNADPKHTAHWLNLLADLQIKCADDKAAAGEALRRIVERFPDTALAGNARRRIAFLTLETRAQRTGQSIKLGSYEDNLGLKSKDNPPP